MNKIIFLLIGLLFITGCTVECPECKCPTCTSCPEPIIEEDFLQVYFIDVGQGDASLIKYGDTEMLIDCGKNNQGPVVVDFLKKKV